MRDDNWDDLRFFLAAARGGSFAAAARSLGVNESTTARRIARAERRLGTRLFERLKGRLDLTPAGERLRDRAEAVEREVEAAEVALSGADRQALGKVRVTAVPLLVNRVLLPALPSLLSDHPDLSLEFIAEPRDLSLTKREADLALRLARPAKELRAVARRVGYLSFAVYAPAGPVSAAALPWITYADAMADLPQARWIAQETARAGRSGSEAAPRVLVNDAEAILAAVEAGLGKSLLPVALGDSNPALRRLGAGPASLRREIWLMTHPELKDLPRIKAVTDWLVESLDTILSARTAD